MGRRRSPYLVNSKRPKHKAKYDLITASDQTSQHSFYRAQSKGPEQGYSYFDELKNYEDFYTSDFEDSRIFRRYDSKRRGSGESNTFDDYTTSAVSNSLKKRRKDRDFSGITSDDVSSSRKNPEKYDEVSSYIDYEYSNLNNRRDKQQNKFLTDESEQFIDRRKYRSTSSKYYEDLIHEEPEKEFDFEKYFEKTNSRVANPPKQKRRDKYEDTRKKQNLKYSKASNREQGYHIYAYHEPKHNTVFKSKRIPEDLSFTSEVEIKTHEYPILAFRDKNPGEKRSDMVYLPVIVLDKKSGKPRLEKKLEQPINPTNKEDFQVFAANFQDQNNIFQNFGNFSNVTTSKVPVSQEIDNTPKTDFGTKITSGVQYAGSLLGSIIDEALINETKADQELSFTQGKTPFTYQVGVDLLPQEPIGNTKPNGEKSSLMKNKSITDPVNNDYPVSKDYIRVSVSEQQQKNKEEAKNSQAFQIINDNKIAMSIAEGKASQNKKSIMRSPSQVGQEVKATDKQTSNMTLANTAGQGYKIAARASHVESGNGGGIKEKSSKTSVVNERASQSFNRQSGSHKQGSIVGSKAATSGLIETARGSETRLTLQAINRNSMKSEKQNESRISKVPTTKTTPPSQLVHDQKSVIRKQPSMDRISTVAQFAETSPIARNPSEFPAEGRKSAVTPRHSEANLIKDDSRKSKIASVPETKPKSMVGSSSKKSLVPSSAHHNSKEKRKWPLKIDEEDNSEEAIRTFAKEIFQTDYEPKKKSTLKFEPHKSIASQVKPTTLAESPVSENQLRLSHSTRLPSNDGRKSEITNNENKPATNNAPKDENEKRMQRSLSRTSRILTVLSKLGKKKSSEKVKSYIPTSSPTGSRQSEEKIYPEPDSQNKGDSQFVRSIEPTVTQYKKENNKTQPLKKSKSKQDNKPPKEQKSLTRLFSRSKSKLGNEANDRTTKKKKKSKSRSFLGILKRSKSSNKSVSPTPRESEQTLPPDQVEIKEPQECECFVKYARTMRECAYFFLGLTLHEQIMNVLDAFVGVKS